MSVTLLAVRAIAADAPAEDKGEPFAWGDFTWMNGQSRQKTFPLTAWGGAVTPSVYVDVNYAYSMNHPRDNTLTGCASIARHNELALNLASIGLDWNYKHVIGRLSLQYGNTLNIVQDLDPSVARGRSLSSLRYIREAAVGYHFDAMRGINVEAGLFSSYIGLESYLLAENWNYSHSLVGDHTPFYLQGIRAQFFPTARLKIEPWLMNGWQTYGKMNLAPSGGLALRWSPSEGVSLIANFYLGTDTKGVDDRLRFHSDHSVNFRYFDRPGTRFISKAAFSVNNHIGFESGGIDSSGAPLPGPGQAHMLGSALASRVWFMRDLLALTVRPEVFSNPTSYLAQYAPPGFATGPGTKPLQVWGITGTFDVMPTDFFSLRFEAIYRKANVPYFAGPGGTTSPSGFQPTPAAFTPDAVDAQTLLTVAANFRL